MSTLYIVILNAQHRFVFMFGGIKTENKEIMTYKLLFCTFNNFDEFYCKFCFGCIIREFSSKRHRSYLCSIFDEKQIE